MDGNDQVQQNYFSLVKPASSNKHLHAGPKQPELACPKHADIREQPHLVFLQSKHRCEKHCNGHLSCLDYMCTNKWIDDYCSNYELAAWRDVQLDFKSDRQLLEPHIELSHVYSHYKDH